jgi:pimeloyl-ACP methyl ester carboxylesterase
MRSSGINPFAIIAQQTFDGLYEQFNQASLPVCLLAGKQDAILPIEWFRLLVSQFTSIETHEQEQCGHSFFAEYPETFNSAVGTFVNTCLSRQIINDVVDSQN